MSSYVVLARKWRPAQFSDIVGQAHIVRTLTNAIRLERIHQAYLFTGSRGIGKTSIARIFAKLLRCENRFEQNGLFRSCDHCPNCEEITTSSSVDVIEIDGASNNGVEAVREIRENAKYMPSSGMRKIYIIDEVHMLTTAAFNALLKTLEEPPAHVIFIFATTEPHKIPATILSRCQRFDYRKVTSPQIQARLTEVVQSEEVKTEAGALSLIARAAEGSMRDALSLLDQVIAFSGNQITTQSVRESIGLIENQVLVGILSGIFKKKPLESLRLVEQVYQQGHDLRVLTRNLIEILHATLLAKLLTPNTLDSESLELTLEVAADEWKEIQGISELRNIEEIEIIFQVLHQGLEWIARSSQPKIILDILLIKCATADALVYIDSAVNDNNSGVSSEPPKVPSGTLTANEESSTQAISTGTTRSWENFIEHVRGSRPLLASILEHCSGHRLSEWNNSSKHIDFTIYFSPQDAYFKEQLQSRAYQEQLSHLSKSFFGTAVRIQIELKDMGESLAARRDREQREQIETAKEKAQNHPIILEAKSLFGGDLGPIEIRENTHANLQS